MQVLREGGAGEETRVRLAAAPRLSSFRSGGVGLCGGVGLSGGVGLCVPLLPAPPLSRGGESDDAARRPRRCRLVAGTLSGMRWTPSPQH